MIRKIIIIICGIIFMAFGTWLCNYTNFGIDPFNALCVGSSNMLNISLGTFTLVAQFIIAVLILFIQKRFLGIGSLVPMISFGYILQVINEVMESVLPTSMSIIASFVLFGVGMVCIALGMSLYMNCDLGMVPYDAVSFSISEKINKNPFLLRVIIDVSIASLAFLVGGPIQVGTILLAFGIGPILKVFKPITNKVIKRAS